jgi:ABC-type Fe3+-siderophore transport system permease subunit
MRTRKTMLVLAIVSSFLFGETITIHSNTVVPVKTQNVLSSNQLKTGQEVMLYVAQDVLIKGKTVIKAGTVVLASVDESKEGQMAGIPGKLLISLQTTTAVDGSTVALTGSLTNAADSEVGATVAVGVILCPLALLNSGDDGIIPAGSQMRAMTLGTIEVEIDE